MKIILKFSILTLIFLCSFFVCMDRSQLKQKRMDVEEAMSLSMRNTLKASTYTPMYEMNEQDMNVEFIRMFAQSTQQHDTYHITFHETSLEGLLDISLQTSFTHLNGKQDQRVIRKTLLVESFQEENG